MLLDIRNPLYTTDHLELKRTNYIFGTNGTGKSTLTRLIRAQCSADFDVRVFQGFDSIIGSDERLNAVVLGEENAQISGQIEKIRDTIRTLELGKQEKEAEITLPDKAGAENLAVKQKRAETALNEVEKKLDKFFSDAAKRIKTRSNPVIAVPSYNKKNFLADMDRAALISDDERRQYEVILRSEVRSAPQIVFPVFDMDALLDETNTLLARTVEEKLLVARLENDPRKQRFASDGIHLHKRGDICAFCGSVIPDSVFEELGSYFSADETRALQAEIEELLTRLQDLHQAVQRVQIPDADFYPAYAADVNKLALDYAGSVPGYMTFFTLLSNALREKLGCLFTAMAPLQVSDRPWPIRDFSASYAILRQKNNADDLAKNQQTARERLRLDAVKRELEAFGYEMAQSRLEARKNEYGSACQAIRVKEDEIRKIDQDIVDCGRRINTLLAQTRNEQKLAININKKLRSHVSFELEHCEDLDHKGYYQIKDPQTGISRAITQLSTGEKNIIAFLYFLEKLEEVDQTASGLPKMIVFDDPMNSNDAAMRHMITRELQQLVWQVEQKGKDTLVILTHNIDCYVSLCRKYSDSDYQTRSILHLEKSGSHTTIHPITCRRDDFTSNYGQIWRDLIHMYNDPYTHADMMLNTMRRILETYTSFNGRNLNKFCDTAGVPLTLFHAGSHAESDLNTPVNLYSKPDLLLLFWKCFDVNRCSAHVRYYWPGVETLLSKG